MVVRPLRRRGRGFRAAWLAATMLLPHACSHSQVSAIAPGQRLAGPGNSAMSAEQAIADLAADRRQAAEHPESATAELQLATALRALGANDAALQALERTLALDPHLTAAMLEEGSLLADRSDYSGASDLFRRAIAVAPQEAAAHLWLGDMLLRSGDFDKALAEFRTASRLDPKDAGTAQGSGLVKLQQGDFAAAAAEFRRALAMRPNYLDAERGLAHALSAQHVWKEAAQMLQRIVAASPDSSSDAVALGNALLAMGDKAQAQLQFTHARELSDRELILLRAKGDNNWGISLRRDGKIIEAAEAFRRSLAEDSGFCEAHDNLGGVLWMQKDGPAAMKEFEAAVQCDPRLASARNNLGTAFLYEGRDPERAIEQFRAAIALEPGFALAHLNLAKALASLHNLSQAEPEFRTALAIDPSLAAAHVGLGLLLAMKQQGVSPEARAEMQEGIRLDPHLRQAIPQSYLAQLQEQ